MPNRYVRESAIESERVNALSWQGEVFYRRLINRVDDFGRYTAHPELLRASIFPMQLNKVSAADVVKLLLECEQAGLIGTWKGQLDGKSYLIMPRCDKGRATTSKYPEPPEHVCRRLQPFAHAPDSGTDSGTDKKRAPKGFGAIGVRSDLADEEWLKELAGEPHYAHIRVGDEYGKMQRWCQVNHRQPTRRRLVNWLNRIERPLARGEHPPKNKILSRPQPAGWLAWLKKTYPLAIQKDYWRVSDDVKLEFESSKK